MDYIRSKGGGIDMDKMKKNQMLFTIGEYYTFNKCRACGQKAVIFGIIQSNEEWEERTYHIFEQAPIKGLSFYCPYCGKREMWKEDE